MPCQLCLSRGEQSQQEESVDLSPVKLSDTCSTNFLLFNSVLYFSSPPLSAAFVLLKKQSPVLCPLLSLPIFIRSPLCSGTVQMQAWLPTVALGYSPPRLCTQHLPTTSQCIVNPIEHCWSPWVLQAHSPKFSCESPTPSLQIQTSPRPGYPPFPLFPARGLPYYAHGLLSGPSPSVSLFLRSIAYATAKIQTQTVKYSNICTSIHLLGLAAYIMAHFRYLVISFGGRYIFPFLLTIPKNRPFIFSLRK